MPLIPPPLAAALAVNAASPLTTVPARVAPSWTSATTSFAVISVASAVTTTRTPPKPAVIFSVKLSIVLITIPTASTIERNVNAILPMTSITPPA